MGYTRVHPDPANLRLDSDLLLVMVSLALLNERLVVFQGNPALMP
jgi:hypothetical protein